MAQNISPRLTQDIEKADIPDGRGNGQIIQNITQKKVNWPWKNGGPKMTLNSYKVHIFVQNKA
jgi:hypothetical protein